MRSRDHLSYGITQCYLLPGRDDSPNFMLAFTSTHFTIPWKMEGWVNLGTAVRVRRHCSKVAQPVPKAVYHIGCCDKHKSIVGFDPGTSHTAVECLTSRPLHPTRWWSTVSWITPCDWYQIHYSWLNFLDCLYLLTLLLWRKAAFDAFLDKVLDHLEGVNNDIFNHPS